MRLGGVGVVDVLEYEQMKSMADQQVSASELPYHEESPLKTHDLPVAGIERSSTKSCPKSIES